MKDSSNEELKNEANSKIKERKIPIFVIAFVGTLVLACGIIALFSNKTGLGGGFNAMMNKNLLDGGIGSGSSQTKPAAPVESGQSGETNQSSTNYNTTVPSDDIKNVKEDVKCDIANCLSCSKDNYCSECSGGYKPTNGICIKDEPTHSIILTPDNIKNVKEYVKCDIANCLSCSKDNYCSECISGYKPTNGICAKDEPTHSIILTPDNIKNVKEYVKCNIANCLSCSKDNYCSECSSGYIVSSDGKSCLRVDEHSDYVNPQYCYHIDENATSNSSCIIKSSSMVYESDCLAIANNYWGQEPACPYAFKTISCSSSLTASEIKDFYNLSAMASGACRNNGYDESIMNTCKVKYILGIPIKSGNIVCRKTK